VYVVAGAAGARRCPGSGRLTGPRVLLVDSDNRMLLLHGLNPSAPAELFHARWLIPGNGCRNGQPDDTADGMP
jgi:hypothetical protein